MNDFRLQVGARVDSVQRLAPPPNNLHRFEGIAFSSSGNTLAVATSDTDTVLLFRCGVDGRFEDAPYGSIDGPSSGLKYPHDVAFSPSGDTEFLAVAQRGDAIAIYERNPADGTYGPGPVFRICGPQTKLNFSDGVAFVPPNDDYLAACNLESGSISFYRRISRSPIAFELEPVLELKHSSLRHPDGLAFSRCGRWLAIANHGNHTVSIFRRRQGILSCGKLSYGRRPVTVIKDPSLRHPHSVAFSAETNHLIVTNAGANFFSVYERTGGGRRTRWSQAPVTRTIVGPDASFRKVNVGNKMEGGPKGIAIHQDRLAICSPEHGVKIYSLREIASQAA
jgi:DNA-binding beta-propeller fold protein YncE